MIIEIGHFSVIVALVLSVYGMVSAAFALRTDNVGLGTIGTHGPDPRVFSPQHWHALVGLFLHHPGLFGFSTSPITPIPNCRFFYTVAAVWGGHEGSLLLWVFILSVFSTLAVWLHWRTQPAIMPYLIAVESAVIFGFLCLIVFLSSPFERLLPVPLDGKDSESLAARTQPWSCTPRCSTWDTWDFPSHFPSRWQRYFQAAWGKNGSRSPNGGPPLPGCA